MRSKIRKIFLAFVMLFCMFAQAGNAFAANIYGITYSGGSALSTSNVVVDPTLSNLVRLNGSGTVTYFSSSSKWSSGYRILNGECVPYQYIRIWNSSRITDSDDVSYVVSNDDYDVKVKINKIVVENASGVSSTGNAYIIGIGTSGGIGASYTVYTNKKCTTELANQRHLNVSNDERIFVQVNATLYKHEESEPFTLDQMYFGITDIDAAQSYKILNPTALLTAKQMYAMNTTPFTVVDGHRNRFVASGNFIYSEDHFGISSGSNVYVIIDQDVQTQGIDVVFGFRDGAGSNIQYYARQLNVKYESDDNGAISGIAEENLLYGLNPSGSATQPNAGFAFDYWVADKDVTLGDTDSTVITAGTPMTPEQVMQVKVTEDLVFTAIHRDIKLDVTYESDEHGEITGKTSERVIPNDSPTGTEEVPERGYEFDHWEADKDVTLEDDTVISAGDPIDAEQLLQIIVTENLTFTAIHRDERLDVAYRSDNHGRIIGKRSEVVLPEANPTGSEEAPEAGFEFDHWIADKNVTLEDDTVITAGDPITSEQVLQVVVTEDLVFTAIHRDIRLDVTYESDEHGTITGITEEKVVPNDNPSGTEVSPVIGYELDHWEADKNVTLTNGDTINAGEPLSSEQVAQVVVTENLAFTAIHRDERLDVNYKSDEYGRITGKTSEIVLPSGNPTGTEETPVEGYALDYWEADKDVTLTDGSTIDSGNPITSEQILQVVVTEDITFTAIHRDIRLDITYTSDDYGEITGITEERVLPNDNPSGTEETPEQGYALDYWTADKDVTLTTGDTIPAGSPITPEQVEQVVVTEDLVFTAIHRDIKLDVTYTSDEHGEITGKTSERVIPNNNPTGSSTQPNAGYAFDHWEADKNVTLTNGDTVNAGNPLTNEQVLQVIVTESIEFTAVHRDVRLDVTYESDDHGTITGITEEKVIPNGNPSGSEDTPEQGYALDYWTADKDVTLTTGDTITAGSPITPEQVEQVVVTEDLVFTAIHRDIKLDVTYTSDEHGAITGITSERVLPNDNPSGTEDTPEIGYELDHWVADKDVVLEDGTEIAAGIPINLGDVEKVVVTENLVFTAIHLDTRVDITYESDEHGEITGITEEKVVPNDNPSGTEDTPEEGYALDYWEADVPVTLEDGTEIPAGDPIEPEQVEQIVVTEDITLTAVHKDIRKKIIYESDEGGEITGIEEEPVKPNDNPTGSEEEPKEYYVFKYWIADIPVILGDGTEIPAGDPITPEQVPQIVVVEDITLTAIHEDIRKKITYESDEGGEITGIEEEPVVPEGNPSGTEEKPKDDYEFDHWEADKPVILDDGTEIPAGDPIEPEQIPHIIVTEDITLTAIHKKIPPEVPNTGAVTENKFGAMQATISILGIAIIAVVIKVLPKMFKKKMGFDE